MADLQRDAGVSLVEVLISIVIIGICFAGLLAGLGTSVLASGQHRSQTEAQAFLVSAAEAAKDQSRNPFSCPASFSFTSGVTPPEGWDLGDLKVLQVEYGYWDGVDFHVVGTTNSDCNDATDLQRLTLQASGPDGNTVETLVVLKRRST